MPSTPSFAATEAYQFMADNQSGGDGIWLSSELALRIWVEKTEAIALMRELAKCGLFSIKSDSVDACSGTLVPQTNPDLGPQ